MSQIDQFAKKVFESIAPEVRVRILNNVWCMDCRRTVGIGITSMEVVRGDLVLKGLCTKCGGPVARLIEDVAMNVKPRTVSTVVEKNSSLPQLFEYSPAHRFSRLLKDLEPLSLEFIGPFCPADILFCYEDPSNVHPALKPVLEHAPRGMWEMQQILPFPGAFGGCPIDEGVSLHESGRTKEAISLVPV